MNDRLMREAISRHGAVEDMGMKQDHEAEGRSAPEPERGAHEAQMSRAARLRKLIEQKLENGDQRKPGVESPR